MTRIGREAFGLAALACLSWANVPNGGGFANWAVALIVLAVALLLAAVFSPSAAMSPRVLALLALATTGAYVPYALAHVVLAPAVLAIVCFAPLLVLVRRPPRRRLVLALASAGLAGLLFQGWRWGSAGIDVFASIQAAASSVLHGRNPYDAVFPVYVLTPPHQVSTRQIHYQYGPLLPYLAAPGRLIGDVRAAGAVALLGLGACAFRLARSSPHRQQAVPVVAALSLGFPFVCQMILNAWADSFMMAGFAGWVALRLRHPRWAVAMLAAALLVKPTIAIALVVPMVWSRSMRRECVQAALGATLFTLPFAILTGPAQLYADIIGVQLAFPPRTDAVTLSSALYWSGHGMLPGALAAVGTLGVAILTLRRRPADLADVMLGSALISTVSFVLAKWAFFNYYFIPAVLLVLFIASRDVPMGPAGDIALPRVTRRRWDPRQAEVAGAGRAA